MSTPETLPTQLPRVNLLPDRYPIPAETGNTPSYTIHEAIPALSGLRGWGVPWAIRHPEGYGDGRPAPAEVKQELAKAVIEGRFPAAGHEAVTRKEWRVAKRAGRRRNGVIAASHKRDTLEALYGYEDETGSRIYLTNDEGQYINRSGEVVVKRKDRVGAPNYLGTPEREEELRSGRHSRARVKSERRTLKYRARAQRRLDKNKDALGRTITGDREDPRIYTGRHRSSTGQSEQKPVDLATPPPPSFLIEQALRHAEHPTGPINNNKNPETPGRKLAKLARSKYQAVKTRVGKVRRNRTDR